MSFSWFSTPTYAQPGRYGPLLGSGVPPRNDWNNKPAAAGAGGSLASQYQAAYDEAKAANEKRYQDILSGMEGMGKQEAADISTRWRGVGAQQGQDLVSRGLVGTTIKPTLQNAAARGESADLGALQDRLKSMKFGFMERRTDEYPDLNQMIQLAQMQGAYGGGGAAQTYNGYPQTWRYSGYNPAGAASAPRVANYGKPAATAPAATPAMAGGGMVVDTRPGSYAAARPTLGSGLSSATYSALLSNLYS